MIIQKKPNIDWSKETTNKLVIDHKITDSHCLSGVYGPSTVAHIQGAWQIYQHSGNKTFLELSYKFYKELYWDGINSKHWLYAYDSG